MHFEALRLIEPLLRAVRSEGYTTPTPIQQLAIPPILQGRDVMGCAQTGTGKTAAFALPILQLLATPTPHTESHSQSSAHTERNEGLPRRLHSDSRSHHAPSHGGNGKTPHRRAIRALILTPTRELAAQVAENFQTYGRHLPLRHSVVFGGVTQHRQVKALRDGVDILIATPGRLLDLSNQRLVNLTHVEIFVLDEADRMLDMGFIHDIRRLISLLPGRRQNLMFSATMPGEISKLARTILREPVTVQAASNESAPPELVDQSLYHVDSAGKTALLEHLLKDPQVLRALVFTRTKRRADYVAKSLNRSSIATEAIHSNKSQNARTRAMANFKRGVTRVLVASDIASRGLDVDQISHVFNYDLPNTPETYVHRIGRTGRAGATGQAISFCSHDQRQELKDIERHLGQAITVRHHAIAKISPESWSPTQSVHTPHQRGRSHHHANAGASGSPPWHNPSHSGRSRNYRHTRASRSKGR